MIPPSDSVTVRVSDASGVGEARRASRRAADDLGLGDVAAEQAAIVATEASRNVLDHAGGGQVVVTATHAGVLDVLALDAGPGIPDLARAMRDGYSSRGTRGQGLGAISRIASVFDIYSAPGKGTALLARISHGRPRLAAEVGAVCVAVAPEPECGDAWAVETPSGRLVAFLADGLGHGCRAAEAARAGVAAFRKNATLPAGRLVETVHAALRSTRGAAVAVAELTGEGDLVRYAGIGNVSGVLLGSRMRKMVSLAGTAGHVARSIRPFEYDWPEDGLLVMHSDGIATHWDLSDYPGLASRHPALIAGVLYRDFSRGRDDATVIVVRRKAA